MMLFNGGTLYIDHGKPVPHLIMNTVDNLRELSPTLYFNVPKGFNDLLPYLEADSSLRDHFSRIWTPFFMLAQPFLKTYGIA